MAKFTRSNNAILPDGDRVWDANQSMDTHRITHAQNAVDPQDYITKAQTFPRITETDATNGIYTIYVNWNTGNDDITGQPQDGDGTVGNQFKTPHRAFDWLSDYSIDSDVTVKILCAAGIYQLTETLQINHPQGSQIQIVGESFSGVIDPTVPTTVGGAGRDKTISIDVQTWEETPTAGQFALFYNVTGNDSSVYNGGYEIIDTPLSGNFNFRFKAFPTDSEGNPAEDLYAPATSGITGDITFIKTVFYFDILSPTDGQYSGISLDDGSNLGYIDKIVIQQKREREYEQYSNGIWLRSTSSMQVGANVVLSGWSYGAWIRFSSVFNHLDGGNSASSNCTYGILAEYVSIADIVGMSLTNCRVGAGTNDNSSLKAFVTHISNNWVGLEISNNSSAEAAWMKNKYNSFGAYLWHGSNLRIGPNTGTFIVSNHVQGIHMRYGNTCHMYDTTLNNTGGGAEDIGLFLSNTVRLIRMDGTNNYTISWPESVSSTINRTTYQLYTSSGNGFDIISNAA